MGRNALDVQLLQRPSDPAQLLLGSIPVMDGSRRDVKQAGLVGLDRHRTPMTLRIAAQLEQFLFHESPPTRRAVNSDVASSIIDIKYNFSPHPSNQSCSLVSSRDNAPARTPHVRPTSADPVLALAMTHQSGTF
jgi:hypothetical protein